MTRPLESLQTSLGHRPTPTRWLVTLLLSLFQASFLALLILRDWNANVPAFLAIYLSAFTAYGALLYIALRGLRTSWWFTTQGIIILAILLRLTVIWCKPTLSEDFYRYVWDGKVHTAGVGPYTYPPNAPQLSHLRDDNYERINYKRFRTIYAPFAQHLFHAITLVSRSSYAFKFVFLLFDILLMVCILLLLKQEQRDDSWLAIYAWHPLAIVEFSGSSHMDVIGISMMMLAVLLAVHQRAASSGVVLAAACLTKYLPVFVFPWLMAKGRWKFLAAAIGAAILITFPFYDQRATLFEGLSIFYRKWRFNDSLFGVLYRWLDGAEPARRAGMYITAAVLLICVLRRFSLYRSMLIVIGTVLLLSPVVHPWYVCWVIPFLVFHHNRAWLFFSGWIAIAYLARYIFPDGLWKPVLWLKLLVYVPFYALLIGDFVYARLKQRTLQDARVRAQ